MATSSVLTSCTMTLSSEERAELIMLVSEALGESRIESHRTHTPEFRERVLGEQSILRGLLEKLRS